MRALQIALYPLGTQFSLVEWEIVTRLKSNHGFIFHQQRDIFVHRYLEFGWVFSDCDN
jgi:hypothetical protein